MNRTLRIYLLASLYAALDVGTLLMLSIWLGSVPTLMVVIASTFFGLISCRRLWCQFRQHYEEQIQEHGANPPLQVKEYLATEALLILISMGLFVFPGLLSDALAYLALLPVVRGRIKPFVMSLQHKRREQETCANA